MFYKYVDMDEMMIRFFEAKASAPWGPSDFALVLGTGKEGCLERAKIAYEYYATGACKRFILCGGVTHDGEKECDILFEEMKRLGVKEEMMYREEESRDTFENLLFALRIASLNGFLLGSKEVALITEPYHMARSILMMEKLYPFFLKGKAITKGFHEEYRLHPERYEREASFLQEIAKMFQLRMEDLIQ